MSDLCDLCGAARLRFAYSAPTTRRGLAVHVCEKCGLLQSLPRCGGAGDREIAVSSGADWGNVRYGKSFRADAALGLLRKLRDVATIRECLDVGASRGAFLHRLREASAGVRTVAIEPDERIVGSYRQLTGVELHVARIEDVELPRGRFDLVHCSHTLEHVVSPARVLRKIGAAMRPDGVLLLEVPNADFIGRDDVMEEFFIDKHLYHFSLPTLRRCTGRAGLSLVAGCEEVDAENILVAATRADGEPDDGATWGDGHAADAIDRIERYRRTLRRNQVSLRQAARRIGERAAAGGVVVWGAGRILDSLVQYGGLSVSPLAGIVDTHLWRLVGGVHGRPVLSPTAIADLRPELVVVASRAYFAEIRTEVLRVLPACEVWGPGELLAG